MIKIAQNDKNGPKWVNIWKYFPKWNTKMVTNFKQFLDHHYSLTTRFNFETRKSTHL